MADYVGTADLLCRLGAELTYPNAWPLAIGTPDEVDTVVQQYQETYRSMIANQMETRKQFLACYLELIKVRANVRIVHPSEDVAARVDDVEEAVEYAMRETTTAVRSYMANENAAIFKMKSALGRFEEHVATAIEKLRDSAKTDLRQPQRA